MMINPLEASESSGDQAAGVAGVAGGAGGTGVAGVAGAAGAAGGAAGKPMRFVVMTCRKGAGPQPLLRVLEARGVTVAVATEAPTVIARLAESGLGEPGALIIDEPSRFKRLAHLLAVVRRYMPHIVCRQYTCLTPDGRPRMAELSDDAERNRIERPSPIPANQPISGPLISKQELAMLIENQSGQTVNEKSDGDRDDEDDDDEEGL